MTEQKKRLVSEFYRAVGDKQQTVELLEKIIKSGENIALTVIADKTAEHPREAPKSLTICVDENDFSRDTLCEILKHERQMLSEMKRELSEIDSHFADGITATFDREPDGLVAQYKNGKEGGA